MQFDFNDAKEQEVQEEQPTVVDCSPEAKAYYIQWHDQLAMEAWLGTEDNEDSMLAKLRGQCLRIALQLHVTDAILDEKKVDAPVSLSVMQRACELADWLKSHQRYAWKMLKGAAAMPTGKELRVAQAVVALESEIENGFLPTARIEETVNQDQEKKFQLHVDGIAKTLRKLGLEPSRTPQKRGWTVTPENLANLRNILGEGVIGVIGDRTQAPQGPPAMTPKNSGVSGVMDENGNVHDQGVIGVSGAMDAHDPEDVEVF